MATQLNVRDPRRHTWMLFIAYALLFVAFAAYNYLYIPNIEPADPDQGWAWLTLDPDVIEYIKFNFRVLGTWVLGFAVLVGALAGLGLRNRQRAAWFAAWYVPAHVLLVSSLMPWVLPITGPLTLIAIAALVWSRRWYFFTIDEATS